MGLIIVAITLTLASLAQSVSYPYYFGTGYQQFPIQQAQALRIQPQIQQTQYLQSGFNQPLVQTRYVDNNGIQHSSTQLTTPAYIGDSLAGILTAIRDFLLQTPFIKESDLTSVPFLPKRQNPTPLPKVTLESFKAAIDELSAATINFVNNPDIMDPNNYLDPTVKTFVTTFGDQFNQFINGMKTYYSTKPNGAKIAATLDRLFGGFTKFNPSSGYQAGGAKNPNALTGVPWDPAMQPLSPDQFAIVLQKLPQFLEAIEPIFEAFDLYSVPWETFDLQNLSFSNINFTLSLESFPDQIAAITRIVMNFIKALQGSTKFF